jgi:hypothetical protein
MVTLLTPCTCKKETQNFDKNHSEALNNTGIEVLTAKSMTGSLPGCNIMQFGGQVFQSNIRLRLQVQRISKTGYTLSSAFCLVDLFSDPEDEGEIFL